MCVRGNTIGGETLDVGVIGVGMMGRNHARVYSELKAVDSLYLYDLNGEAARDLASAFGATVSPTAEDLLRSVDAVSVCVPTPFHFGVAETVLDAGVPLLIEKPVCATAEETRRLIGKIPDDLVVGVGHIERFNPIIPEIKKIVRDPLYIEMKRHNPASSRVSGSSVVEDLMIHDIDIMRNVLLPEGAYHLSGSGNQDVCSALFSFGETPVYLSASRKSSKKIRMIYIEEEEFTIEGDFMAQEIYIHRKPGRYAVEDERYVQENIIEKVLVNKQEPLKLELSTFLDCVAQGRAFPVSPAQALLNMEICEEVARCFAA
ncbi:Inositol 2-dehydrogenase/D-chiro-inositol 3-dehydrogenase [Methanoculleus bourgensis MS2]|uniref:Inositol 2-dehydrogenase/D-chiro-inositol 3-dehydrogenase n=1 Tax=Methanoculleus bourgensis (strain ATCC 43281 / DSM 3045 / OCM 15 / MS2) TaxID=1201294 RepID=I7LJ90_METBM|nr:Inositol 2-dehydrogenase/D-chiro-inositol 3-dehydrogenase [Methanoculleus bourgensis MS2]